MTSVNLNQSPAQMSDDELRAGLAEAYGFLKEAAEKQNNSEWHGSCFAACMVFAMEMNRRGLKHEAQEAYVGLVEHDLLETRALASDRGLGSLLANKEKQ